MKIKHILTAAALVAFSAGAQAALIDFEGETTGAKANGYTVDGITFTDTVGAGLQVGNYGAQGDGIALGNFDDVDGGGIWMDFAQKVNNLTLDFGNDDPAWTNPGDIALLEVYNNGMKIGEAVVEMNRDDIMNQTIGFAGAAFDAALFIYTDIDRTGMTGPNPQTGLIGLIEIVDNINYTTVPEPATLLLLGAGLVGLSFSRKRSA